VSLAILASGMTTGVGLSSAATCAAMRAAITNFVETRFMIRGEFVMGCLVPLLQPLRGMAKLAAMVIPAIRECLAATPARPDQIPLLVGVAEPERPGRLGGVEDDLLAAIQADLGTFHRHSSILAKGKTSAALLLQRARALIENDRVPAVIVAGVDSYLMGATIEGYFAQRRLLMPDNADGFLPGEGAAAILVAPSTGGAEMLIRGIGIGQEKATIDSGEPLRADGMVQAFRAALADGGSSWDDVHYRLTDLNGEQYYFKEAALSIARAIRKVKKEFDIWHPADCVGEIGAAAGPCVFGWALEAARKKYAPGAGVLCHFASDDGTRAAVILQYQS
jgi:3-oxoacyl-[acyl-carrier-protein] synthase-1